MVQAYDFSGGAPVRTVTDTVLERWLNTDPVLNPIIAVDSNLSSFTDPEMTTDTQTDTMVGKAVYVAWNTNNTAPSGAGSTFNPNVIMVAASEDGGNTFTTRVFASDGGNFDALGRRFADPQIVFTQGTADGRVDGGQLAFVWNTIAGGAMIDIGQPDGGDINTLVAAAAIATANGGTIDEATFVDKDAAGNDLPDTAAVSTFTQTLTAADFPDTNFDFVVDLNVILNVSHPHLNQVQITLTGPDPFGGTQTVTLLRNRIDGFGNTVGGTPGLADQANLGRIVNQFRAQGGADIDVGTVFDDDAARNIVDSGASAPHIAHFRPETGSLDVFNGLSRAQLIDSTWTVEITDFRDDDQAAGTPPTPMSLSNWTLHFSALIDTSGFENDNPVGIGSVAGKATAPYPLVNPTSPAAGTAGIGPGVVVAVDNTLGSFSPYQGRMYIAYTGGSGSDTNVFVAHSDDGGATWSGSTKINDDVVTDNFSEGNRPQFMPTLAVDQTTGTLVAMYYDGRYDPAKARVANSIVTSIDGGTTFSPIAFLNTPKTAIDMITGKTVFIEPIPGNQLAVGGLGFGDRQGLVANAGHVVPVFSSNLNTAAASILTATVTIAAGPRIIYGDMGPIVANFSRDGVTYNNTFTTDGTRQFTGFIIEFDRPINPASFTGDDVTLQYRNPLTSASLPANLTRTGTANFTVTPRDLGANFGPGLPSGNTMASKFFVALTTPLSGSGTYSYSIGPTISDKIRRTGVAGNLVDLNQDAITNVTPTDIFAIPTPINGTPFVLPYSQDTLPLIIPGPHVTSTSVAFNPDFNPASADNLVLNGTNNAIDVTFDRDIDPASFTAANILRLMGPVGPITPYIAPPAVTFSGGGGSGATGVAVLGPGGQVVSVRIITGGTGYSSPPAITFDGATGSGAVAVSTISGGAVTGVTVTSSGIGYSLPSTLIPDNGTLDSVFQIFDSLMINDLAVQVSIDHAQVSDLLIVLIAPDGTQVRLIDDGTGTNGFNNTIFDANATNAITASSSPYTGVFRPAPGAAAAVIASPGSGYAVNDILTVLGGTFGTAAQLRVDSVGPLGEITGVTVVRPGSYAVKPFNAVSVTTAGLGLGAKFNLSYANTLSSLNGKNYLGNWTLRITDRAANGITGTLKGWSLNPFTVTPNPPGGTTNRTFRISFSTQTRNGTYSAVYGPDLSGNYITDRQVTTAAISTAGSGYAVNNILTVQGGTFSTAAQLIVTSVSGGAITGVAVLTPGSYSVRPANPVSVNTGAAKFTLTFGNQADTNLNAGVDLLRGGDPNNGTLLPVPFTTGAINTTLPATQTIDSKISVPASFLVQGVTVQLSIDHANIPDLEATLIAPDLTPVKLFTGVGTTGSSPHANFTNTTFDDAAPSAIQAAPTVSGIGIGPGPYTPQLPLSNLKNHGSLGDWTLRIKSNSSNLDGSLIYWSLTLLNSVPGSGLGETVADQFTTAFRVFTQDPTDTVSQDQWTAVGPASIANGNGSGRFGGLAVDPSDPSGNTVYAAGASGGVWKTNNFLNPNGQPTWIPLTDFGPGFSLNTGSIAIFPRNNDPNQSIVFVATGEGDTSTPGVGFLRSMDGGRTWKVLDSRSNFDAQGNVLPISDPGRDHFFVLNATTAFKVIVDPTPLPNGHVIVYAAFSGSSSGGIWRSTNTGGTWSLMRGGNATDVVLAAGSKNSNGNLSILYAAFRGDGVYFTPNAPSALTMTLRSGGAGVPTRRDVDNSPDTAIPVNNAGINPGGNNGRILLTAPVLTGNPLQDSLYQGWLYAAVVTTTSRLQGLYLTKDFGLNWTNIKIPVVGTALNQNPTNNETAPNYDVFANSTGTAQGNYDSSIAIDPNNPAVFYLGGLGGAGSNGQPFGIIRVDTTITQDAQALVAYDNSDPASGAVQFSTTGGVAVKAGGAAYGLFDPDNPLDPLRSPYFNLLRDPDNPFLTNASLRFKNVASFTNDGKNTRWSGFTSGVVGGDQHELLAIRDPLTGHTRIIAADDHAIFTGTDRGDGIAFTGIGSASSVIGTRNGNLQITQFYYGAAQPSTLAADLAGALFYGMAQDDGFPQSAANVLDSGNLNWGDPHSSPGRGDGAGVATDQTGSGSVYQYKWPCCGNDGLLKSDFFKYTSPSTGYISRTTGLLQPGDDPAAGAGQWPALGTINFAVNPIDPTSIVISSQVGRIFLTTGPSIGTGNQWFPIADPSDLDSSQSLAMAFGAPADANAPLSEFIYVGTNGGNIFVTFTGGGVGGGSAVWKDISAGLSGGSVQAIVTNPTRGSREAYAVTSSRVFYMADSGAASPTWVNVTGNLFSTTLGRSLYNDPSEILATLKSLKALQADYRYAIPDDLSNPAGPKHPVLYAGGEGGVYRSLDKGVTWTYFPNMAIDGALQDGGLLPTADVRDLDLALGNINPENGSPDQRFGRNMLVATTYGRATFAIRLDETILLANGDPLYKYAVSPVAGPHVVSVTPVKPTPTSLTMTGLRVAFSGPVDPVTFTTEDILGITDPTGVPVAVASVVDITGGQPHNIYQINFTTAQTRFGFYNISFGPKISDYSGYQMDQDQDIINGEVTPALTVPPTPNNPTIDAYQARLLFQPWTNHSPVLNVSTATVPSVTEDQTTANVLIAAGSSYSVNDVLTVQGGTALTPTQFQVTSVGLLGEIMGFVLFTRGVYLVEPVGPVTVTGGTGTGAMFMLAIVGTDVASFVAALKPPGADPQGIRDADSFPNSGPPANLGYTFVPTAGGSGYSVNDVLIVQGGSFATPAQLQVTAVSGGVITRVALINPGSYLVQPPSPASVNGGTGTGATFTFPLLGAPVGIAVTNVDNSNGVWQFSTDAGINWTGFGSPTNQVARLLEAVPSNRIRFLPNPDFDGLVNFTFRAWDLTDGLTVSGADGSTDDTTVNGGATAYSTATATATILVNFVNEAPQFVKGADQTVTEDSGLTTVTTWATNISAGADLPPDTNETTPSPRGVLNFIVSSTNNGLFSVQPAISGTADLPGTPLGTLTYTLAPNANGVAMVTVQLHDQGGTAFGGVDTSAAQTFTITVTAVNDAPVVIGSPPSLAAVAEDSASPSGATVTALFTSNFSDIKDDQTALGGSTANSFYGVAIIGNTATASQGTWQYLSGGIWTAVGTRALSNALVVKAANSLRFLPAANFNGTPGSLSVLLIETGGATPATGATVNLSGAGATGGATIYSDALAPLALSTFVTAVNDAPVANPLSALLAAVAEDSTSATVPGASVSSLFTGNFSDTVDDQTASGGSSANTLYGVAIIGNSATVAQGTWEYLLSGTWTAVGVRSLSSALVVLAGDSLRFVPAANFNGTPGPLSVRLIETGGATPATGTVLNLSGAATGGTTIYSAASVTLNTSVTAVNDAPVASGSASLAAVNEDNSNPSGATVTTLFSGNFSDATDNQTASGGSSANTLYGVAIIDNAATASQGTWQYFNGSSWNPVGTPDLTTALVVKAADSLRFVPVADFNGTTVGGLSVRLIETGGAAPATGAIVNLSAGGATGGTTIYSAASVALSTSVTAVNDAPVASGSAALAAVAEDTSNPSGATVSTLFSGNFSDATDNQTANSGSSANTLYGVAIIGNAAPASQGAWQYFNGSTWTSIGTPGSLSSALVVSAADSLRFLPAANFNGTPGSLTVRLIETGGATPATGAIVNLSAGGATGGTTIYSAASVVLSTSVTEVNDAPVASGSALLTPAVAEDSTTTSGATVSSLFSGNFSDAADNQTASGGSTADSLYGIAIIGNAGTQGTWEYFNGSSWASVGSRSLSSALVVLAADSLRFLPAPDFNGAIGGLSIRLIETGGATPATGTELDLSGGATGGTTIYSAGPVTLNASVTAVNDAPVASGSASLPAVDEDTANPSGATVTTLFSSNFSDATDDQTANSGSSPNSLYGVAIIGNAATASQGTWQYLNGGTWTPVGSPTLSAALAVKAADRLRFLPAPNYFGSVGDLTVRLIETGGATPATGTTVDLSGGATGGTTIYSADAVTLSTSVTAVNDAPSFDLAGNPTAVNEDAGPKSVSNFASNMSVGPANETPPQMLAGFTVTQTTSTGGLTFTTAPAIDEITGELTYEAAPNANGTATFRVTLMDDGPGTSPDVNTSAAKFFTITVNPVNDPPSFDKGANQTVFQNSSAKTVLGWATNIKAGPPDEVAASQTLNFIVTNDNNSLFSAQPAVAANGTLTFTPATNVIGSATVTVKLHDNAGGDDTSAEQTFTITVRQIITTTNVESSMPAAAVNQQVTFTATVMAEAGANAVLTGKIRFVVDGGTPVVVALNTAGKAKLVRSFSTIGDHTIEATYIPATGSAFAGSSFTFTQQVGRTTKTTLSSTPLSPEPGQDVTFTATVQRASTTKTPVPTGSVTFYEVNSAGAILSTLAANVPLTAGTNAARAGLTVSFATPVIHYVKAVYNAGPGFATSKATASKSIKYATRVEFTVAPDTIQRGVAFNITAAAIALDSSAPTPRGSMQFFVDGVLIQTVTLNAAGQATFRVPGLFVGTHTIKAVYLGSTTFRRSSAILIYDVTGSLGRRR